jgi:hypothetical protein
LACQLPRSYTLRGSASSCIVRLLQSK